MAGLISLSRALLRGLVAFGALAMMAVTVVEVIGRYLLNAPVSGSNEMVELALGLMVMAGIPLVSAQGTHIAVSLIENLADRWWYAGLQRLIELFCLVVACFLAYALILRTANLFETHENAQVLRFLLWPVVALIAFFWGAAALAHLGRLVARTRAKAERPDIV